MDLGRYSRLFRSDQDGLALPTALMLVMVISIGGSIFASTTVQNLRTVTIDEATQDTFQVAEGALHNIIRQISANPQLWREKVALATAPSGYTEFTPLTYSATNGIPPCSGALCLRQMFPTGGGLIKNYGPIGGDGDNVDDTATIVDQLNDASLPDPDVTLNSQSAWAQVEHMDESLPGSTSIGGDLINNPVGGTVATNIRFRITGTTLRTVRERQGRSTVMAMIEVPAA